MSKDNVYPLDNIRRYRVEIGRREIGHSVYKTAVFLLEVSTITAVLGRGLKYISRELGYDTGRKIRFPID